MLCCLLNLNPVRDSIQHRQNIDKASQRLSALAFENEPNAKGCGAPAQSDYIVLLEVLDYIFSAQSNMENELCQRRHDSNHKQNIH